ncbi:hypothetical protein J4403_02345 [Candidatus Woesearchaeota archaeon]|nr:hypothetical protein [Candidatus Woesearchaeota archaeon]
MDLIVDANILFSILIKQGKTEELIFKNEFHLFTPEYIFEEFEKHKSEIIEKTQRNSEDFNNLTNILKKRINTISNEETERFIMAAKKISPDPDDIDYFALALKIKCPIWSQDKKLKLQKKIIKYTLQKK